MVSRQSAGLIESAGSLTCYWTLFITSGAQRSA